MRPAPLKSLLAVACLLALPVAQAAEGEALLEMKNTIVNMLDALVEQGILTKEKAEQIKQEAAMKAARDATAQTAEAQAAAEAEAEATADADAAAGKPGQVVRVPYVPEFVKEEIREQVRAELRKDVRDDVIQVAKEERWGVKDALPNWVNAIEIHGDVRMRAEAETFSDDNPDFVNLVNDGRLTAALTDFVFSPQRVNEIGQINLATAADGNVSANLPVARNTSEERIRYPGRIRLNLVGHMADHLVAGMRLTTGNIANPVSINQNLGNTGQRFEVQFDHAYIQYDWLTFDRGPVIRTAIGRYERPWLPQPTELLWDNDLQFEGASITVLQGFGRRPNPYAPASNVFLTAGAFPLGEVALSTQDRYMLGIQGGSRWQFTDRLSASFGLAYYDFRHATGRINRARVNPGNAGCDPGDEDPRCFFEDRVYDYTVPGFLQNGNTLMNIRVDEFPNDAILPVGLAPASDFNILNLTGQVDFGIFDPYHVAIDFDVAKNLGYDTNDILERVRLDPAVASATGQTSGTALFNNSLAGCRLEGCLQGRTLAYAVMVTFGNREMLRFGDWQLMGQYRYLERDSVVDSFTESNFAQGSTDVKGFVLAGLYGLNRNTWVRLRYMSADEIEDKVVFDSRAREFVSDGAPIGIDRLQFDVNARF